MITSITKIENSIIRIQKAIAFANKITQLSNNKYIKFLKKHPTFFVNLISLRYPLSYKLIEKFELYLNWEYLSANVNLKWTEEFIEKYKHRWHWTGQYCLSHNPALPWSRKLIDTYLDKWDWRGIWSLSTNTGIPFNKDLIQCYATKWNWHRLSWNQALRLSNELVGAFKDKWNWKGLSLNKTLTNDIKEQFADKFNFRIPQLVIEKPQNLNEETIEQYREKWDWNQLSWDEDIPWTIKLIVKYEDRWNFGEQGLSKNEALPWSLELIKKYEHKWNFYRLSANKSVWERAFKPYINDEIIVKFFEELGVN